MSKIRRSCLNRKIGLILETFERMNVLIKQYDIKFFEYYEELRDNLISILNEIVDNYTYKNPEIEEMNKFKLEYESLVSENDFLKQKVNELKKNNFSSVQSTKKTPIIPKFTQSLRIKSPLMEIEEKLSRVDRLENDRKRLETFNGLLQWKNLKDLNTPVNNLTYKSLTQKQLLDFINELYIAKATHDEGCRKQKQPLETLEQFMFNHLKKKYGLNSIVLEWVFGVIEGIKIYNGVDNDVAVFGLVI